MQIADRLNTVNEYYFSQKLRQIDEMNKQGKNVLNLGIGSPDMPPHPAVVKALHEHSSLAGTHAYQSYKGSPVLRRAIAAWYDQWYAVQLDADKEILPLMGSKEGIMHICMTYLNAGDKVLVPNPGYPTYRSAVEIAGGEVLDYSLSAENGWMPDFEQIEEAGLQQVKMMFVSYPHMPTGALPQAGTFEALIAFARKHQILLVHDNPYSFILNAHPQSILSAPGAMEVAIELNSLSKSHNMAGWRIGMMVGNQQRINEVIRFMSNMQSGMFLPLQMAAATALGLGQDWHDQLNAMYRERQQKAFELLRMLHCGFDEQQAGLFVWASVPQTVQDGFALSDQVLEAANVFLTPGGIFGSQGNGYVRISLCSTKEKFTEAIERLQRVFNANNQLA